MRTLRDNGKELLRHYDSWAEAIDTAQDTATKLDGKSPASSRKIDDDLDWSGFRTFEESIHYARIGWTEGRRKIKELSAQISQATLAGRSLRPQMAYNVTGFDVDIGRYLEGEPECMTCYQNEGQQGKQDNIVKIAVNTGYSCLVSSTRINNRGAAIASLVDLLEEAGRRVELVIACTAAYRIFQQMSITVKRSDQPLDVDVLAYALTSPATHRRIFFAHLERENQETRKKNGVTGGNYGIPTKARHLEADIDLTEKSEGIATQEEAQDWILAELRKQGIEIEE